LGLAKFDVRGVRVKKEKTGTIGWAHGFTAITSGRRASPNVALT